METTYIRKSKRVPFVQEILLLFQIHTFTRDTGSHPISCIKASDISSLDPRVAIGYSDGLVNIFNMNTGDIEAHFRAGCSRVTSMDLKNDLLVCAAVTSAFLSYF